MPSCLSEVLASGALRLAAAALLAAALLPACVTAAQRAAPSTDDHRQAVRAAFDRWRAGTGGPFELLAEDAEWTIVGSSPLSKTYHGRERFLEEVIRPFNARMATPLVPSVRAIYADGDTVIVLFDAAATARDGRAYRNTYTWYLRMAGGEIVEATAFFDTRLFDEMWTRVAPE